jgi:hypothetical protein
MTKAKVSKIDFIRKNPEATYEEFFKATGGSKQNYYSNKWLVKKGVKAKPVKVREHKRRNVPKVKAHARGPRGASEIIALSEIELLKDVNESIRQENQELKHQIVGFRAVISYLEDLAGIRNSQ